MNHRLLFPLIFATTLALAPSQAADIPLPGTVIVKETEPKKSLSEQAEDVWSAFILFPDSDFLKTLVELEDAELVTTMRKKINAIRPCCKMLQSLPPERAKELLLLADAVLWQSQLLSNVYLGEFGIECEAPFDVGLLDLSHSAKLVKEVLRGRKAVSPEVESVLRELVQLVGGEQVLDYPAAWHDEQRCENYETALHFYKDFCAAASTGNEAQAIAKLKDLKKTLAGFAAKGEAEIWRIHKLSHFFHATLVELQKDELYPFPKPMLPEKYRTPARMRALQPFTDTLPSLKILLYQ